MNFPLEGHKPKYALPTTPQEFAAAAVELMDRVDRGDIERGPAAWSISHGDDHKAINDEPQLCRACHWAWDVGEFEFDKYPGPEEIANSWAKIRTYLEDFRDGKRYPVLWYGLVNYIKPDSGGATIFSTSGAVRVENGQAQTQAGVQEIAEALANAAKSVQAGSDEKMVAQALQAVPERIGKYRLRGKSAHAELARDFPPFKQ